MGVAGSGCKAAGCVLQEWIAGARRQARLGEGREIGRREIGRAVAVRAGATARRTGGAGRVPACQSWKICSRRPKMRARAVMIKAWIADGIQAHFSCACAVRRRWAILSPREGACVSMCWILTNGYRRCKRKCAI